MPFIKGGDMFTYLRNNNQLDENQVQLFIAEILLALGIIV